MKSVVNVLVVEVANITNCAYKKTGNVCINRPLRHVCATTVALVKRKVLHILRVFAALGIQHAKHTCHIVMIGLSVSTIFSHIISYTAKFSEGLLNIKCVFRFSSKTFVRNIFRSKMRVRYNKKCMLVFK
jgi:hypothetical protein